VKQFKDATGRDWDITVNVNSAKRVRDLVSVDIFNLYSTEADRVFSDPITLVNVLYALCEEQVKQRKVVDKDGNERPMNDNDFGEALFGDAIEQAATAMLEEVADFFQSSRRKILRAQLEKATTVARKLEAKQMELIEKMDVDTLLEQMVSRPSTK
jgi:hypothetical protein